MSAAPMPTLIYCADNVKYGAIAKSYGFELGARLPSSVSHPIYFADQDWKKPNRDEYLTLLRRWRPALATVLDWELPEQLLEVLGWAEEAAAYVDTVIVIPKVHGGIVSLPRTIGGKEVRLGYSVPTKYGATEVFIGEFIGWPVHALGGSPKQQMDLARYLDVKSADGNYIHHKIRHGQFFDGKRWLQLAEAGIHVTGAALPEMILNLSLPNIMKAWAS